MTNMLDIFKRRRDALLKTMKDTGQSPTIDLDATTDQSLAARASIYRDGGPVDCDLREAARRLAVRRTAALDLVTAQARRGAPEDVRRRTLKVNRLEREILDELDRAIEATDRAIEAAGIALKIANNQNI